MCLEGGGYFTLNGHDWVTEQFTSGRLSDVKGYLIKAEIKMYPIHGHVSNGPYLALEGVYKIQSYNWQDSIHLSPPYLTTFRDSRCIYCFDLKLGKSNIYKSGIIFDWYFGLGVRIRNVTTSLTPQQVNALQVNDDINYDSDITEHEIKPAKNVYPNFVLGFKIGYCIK